jgi:hypothetical protein
MGKGRWNIPFFYKKKIEKEKKSWPKPQPNLCTLRTLNAAAAFERGK